MLDFLNILFDFNNINTRLLTQVLFLPEPKNYPKVDKFQDLKVPKCVLQEMFLLIMSYSLKFIVFSCS